MSSKRKREAPLPSSGFVSTPPSAASSATSAATAAAPASHGHPPIPTAAPPTPMATSPPAAGSAGAPGQLPQPPGGSHESSLFDIYVEAGENVHDKFFRYCKQSRMTASEFLGHLLDTYARQTGRIRMAEDELSKMLLATVRSVCEQYVQFSSVLCIDGLICIRSDAPVIIEPVHIQETIFRRPSSSHESMQDISVGTTDSSGNATAASSGGVSLLIPGGGGGGVGGGGSSSSLQQLSGSSGISSHSLVAGVGGGGGVGIMGRPLASTPSDLASAHLPVGAGPLLRDEMGSPSDVESIVGVHGGSAAASAAPHPDAVVGAEGLLPSTTSAFMGHPMMSSMSSSSGPSRLGGDVHHEPVSDDPESPTGPVSMVIRDSDAATGVPSAAGTAFPTASYSTSSSSKLNPSLPSAAVGVAGIGTIGDAGAYGLAPPTSPGVVGGGSGNYGLATSESPPPSASNSGLYMSATSTPISQGIAASASGDGHHHSSYHSNQSSSSHHSPFQPHSSGTSHHQRGLSSSSSTGDQRGSTAVDSSDEDEEDQENLYIAEGKNAPGREPGEVVGGAGKLPTVSSLAQHMAAAAAAKDSLPLSSSQLRSLFSSSVRRDETGNNPLPGLSAAALAAAAAAAQQQQQLTAAQQQQQQQQLLSLAAAAGIPTDVDTAAAVAAAAAVRAHLQQQHPGDGPPGSVSSGSPTGVIAHVCTLCGKELPSSAELEVHHQLHLQSQQRHLLSTLGVASGSAERSIRSPSSSRGALIPYHHHPSHPSTSSHHPRSMSGGSSSSSVQLHGSSSSSTSGPGNMYIREKKYTCTHCGRGFVTKGHLSVHVRVHTGEKPHICPICGKGFSQSGTLNRHLKSMHTVATSMDENVAAAAATAAAAAARFSALQGFSLQALASGGAGELSPPAAQPGRSAPAMTFSSGGSTSAETLSSPGGALSPDLSASALATAVSAAAASGISGQQFAALALYAKEHANSLANRHQSAPSSNNNNKIEGTTGTYVATSAAGVSAMDIGRDEESPTSSGLPSEEVGALHPHHLHLSGTHHPQESGSGSSGGGLHHPHGHMSSTSVGQAKNSGGNSSKTKTEPGAATAASTLTSSQGGNVTNVKLENT